MNEAAKPYPIGTPGQPWGEAEKAQWLAAQSLKRSYADQVLRKLERIARSFDVNQYGALSIDPERYPLFAVHAGAQDGSRPAVLITGGVHGYETSGVQGALRFLETRAAALSDEFRFVVAPCISPWGYETINRWNPRALDPNRSFFADSQAEEAAGLMALLDTLAIDFVMHIDLHETTDTDNSEFRPALAARDGKRHDNWHIPDGFYTVADTRKPEPGFQRAIIDAVREVTHIAPADPHGRIIGEPIQQPGVICYEASGLGLCMGVTDAAFVSTTEVYPDSPKVDDDNCTDAQVAAVTGGLGYVRSSVS